MIEKEEHNIDNEQFKRESKQLIQVVLAKVNTLAYIEDDEFSSTNIVGAPRTTRESRRNRI